MAGLGILAAAVAVIATRPRADTHAGVSAFEAVRIAAEVIRLRIDGSDSPARRRALKDAAQELPESSLTRAFIAFADGNLAAAEKERAESPFAGGLRGWILVELGRRAEAAEELRLVLKEAQMNWEFRPLFEAALKKAE